MQQQKNILESLQCIALIALYILVIGLLFVAGWYLLNQLMPEPGAFLALYVIIFILAGGLFGAWFWVLIKLPQGLAKSFDPIKNKIASRQITSADEFASEIGNFMVRYFSFFRFDVVAVQIQIKENKPALFPGEIQKVSPENQDFLTKSQASEEVTFCGKVSLDGKSSYAYLLPIWFGKEWLGYISVFSDTRLNIITRNFLKEFEELYLDDQLMHVLFYESLKHKSK